MGQGARAAGLHVEDARDELAVGAVVPGHIAIRARDPLQHAALLPVPGVGAAEVDPAVIILRVDHPDADRVSLRRRAAFEVDLVGEHEAVVSREKEFIVVAAPMEFRPAGDRADAGRGWRGRAASECTEGGEGGEFEEVAAGEHGVKKGVGVGVGVALRADLSAKVQIGLRPVQRCKSEKQVDRLHGRLNRCRARAGAWAREDTA